MKSSFTLGGVFTITYFNLEKGAFQGDPVSAYLFILALEIIFLLIKDDSSTKGIKTFDYVFLYRAYADDSRLFLKNLALVKKLLDIFFIILNSLLVSQTFLRVKLIALGP